MKSRLFYYIILGVIVTVAVINFLPVFENSWTLEKISFKARDGFPLQAYLLKPKNLKKKYPAVACFHQLSGNRDDFLKLFPYFAKAGIVALAPDYPRQKANMNPKRISDLRDSLDYLEKVQFVDPGRLGIITASFSVETGMLAIQGNPNVVANVIISGPVLREESRKWLTLNPNLAIFNIANIHDGNHYLLMEEYIRRSLNPKSRNFFITKEDAPFILPAHGTFVFDEIPQSLKMISDFFTEVFRIPEPEMGIIKNPVPKNMVTIYSTDHMPIYATYIKPEQAPAPAVILYPPEFMSRTYYDAITNNLVKAGFAVLAPNTKRACRKPAKIELCDMEIMGAVNKLKNDKDIDPERIALLLPSFYYLFAKKAIEQDLLPIKLYLLMDQGKINYGIRAVELKNSKVLVKILKGFNPEKLFFYLRKYL